MTSSPPTYDDAIKLNPNALLKFSQPNSNPFMPTQQQQPITGGATNNAFSINSETSRPSSSSSFPNNIINKLKSGGTYVHNENEKSESPPPYTISVTSTATPSS